MKLGLIVAGQYLRDAPANRRAREMLEQVRLARDLGFDSVWMTHHYLIEFQTFQPIPMLGRMAAEAGTMELGTAIYVLPLQHPVEVAENFATLDVLTGGRLIFGVAQGYRDEEFNALGVPRKERGNRFEEGVTLIERLWTEDRVDFHGRHYQVDQATISMRPLRQPRPPIWIGATDPPAIARAARLGDAWLIGPRVMLRDLPGQLAVYRDALRQAGKPLGGRSRTAPGAGGEQYTVDREYPIFREVVVRTSASDAQGAAQHLRTKYAAYARWRYAETSFDDLTREAFVVGDPEGCARTIAERYRDEAGMTHVLARFQTPGVSQAEALRGIRLFGEEVLPKVRR